MNKLLDENSKAFVAIIFTTIIVMLIPIGKTIFLPQICLFITVVILFAQQIYGYRIGHFSMIRLILNLFIRCGILAWFAHSFFAYSIWFPQGTEVADPIHPFALENHGEVSYITFQQRSAIIILKGWAILAAITGLLQKEISRRRAKTTS